MYGYICEKVCESKVFCEYKRTHKFHVLVFESYATFCNISQFEQNRPEKFMQNYYNSLDLLRRVWYYDGTLKKYTYTEKEYLLKKTMILCAKCALSWIFYFLGGLHRRSAMQIERRLYYQYRWCVDNCAASAVIATKIHTNDKEKMNNQDRPKGCVG